MVRFVRLVFLEKKNRELSAFSALARHLDRYVAWQRSPQSLMFLVFAYLVDEFRKFGLFGYLDRASQIYCSKACGASPAYWCCYHLFSYYLLTNPQ